jgi:hypothetical protein
MTETARLRAQLRRTVLGATLLVLAQAAIGMAVNLDVTVPRSHPGARPSDFFAGSFNSVIWAIGHGAAALAIHTTLGLALVLTVIAVAIYALRLRSRPVGVWSALAAALVIGAAFNGASFLDFNHDANSLIMALLAFAAAASYTIVLFLLAE